MGSLMRLSEYENRSASQIIWELRQYVERSENSRLYAENPCVAVPSEILSELIQAWEQLHYRGEREFPVLYAGPGRHPDHPLEGCGGVCGHDERCATHSGPSRLDGPCDCKEDSK